MLLLIREGDEVVNVPIINGPEDVGLPPHSAILVQLRGRLPEDLGAVGAGGRGLPASEAEAAAKGLAAVEEGGFGARWSWRRQSGADGGCKSYSMQIRLRESHI